MTDDPRCCGSGTCIIDPEGRCWCGQVWNGREMVAPGYAPAGAAANGTGPGCGPGAAAQPGDDAGTP